MKGTASTCMVEERLELERGVHNRAGTAQFSDIWFLSTGLPCSRDLWVGLEIRDGSNVFEVPLWFSHLVGSGSPVDLVGFLAMCAGQGVDPWVALTSKLGLVTMASVALPCLSYLESASSF
jgi:hypothetical protein